LRTKIIAWSFIPAAIIFLTVALVAFFAYRQVTEVLAVERDQTLAYLTVDRLAVDLEQYTDLLAGLARTPDVYQNDLAAQRDASSGPAPGWPPSTPVCCYWTPLEGWWPPNLNDPKFWGMIGRTASTIVRWSAHG